MRKRIIPPRFGISAHPVFREYCIPVTVVLKVSEDRIPARCEPTMQEKSVCPICLNEVYQATMLLDCHHSFCGNCLMAWFRIKLECPLCKSKQVLFLQRSISYGCDGDLVLWDPSVIKLKYDSLDEKLLQTACRFKILYPSNSDIRNLKRKLESPDLGLKSTASLLAINDLETSLDNCTSLSSQQFTAQSDPSTSVSAVPAEYTRKLKEIDRLIQQTEDELNSLGSCYE